MFFFLFILGEPFFQTTFYMEAERGNRKKAGSLVGSRVGGFPILQGQMFVSVSNPGMSKLELCSPKPPPTVEMEAWVRTGPCLVDQWWGWDRSSASQPLHTEAPNLSV